MKANERIFAFVSLLFLSPNSPTGCILALSQAETRHRRQVAIGPVGVY